MYTHGHLHTHTSTTGNFSFVYNMAQASGLARFTRKRQTRRGRDYYHSGWLLLNITSLARQTKLTGPASGRGEFSVRTTINPHKTSTRKSKSKQTYERSIYKSTLQQSEMAQNRIANEQQGQVRPDNFIKARLSWALIS